MLFLIFFYFYRKALSKQDEKDYSDPDAMVLGKVYRAKAETKLKELEAYLLNDLTTTAEGEQEEADSPNIQQRAIATEARVFKVKRAVPFDLLV